MNFLPEFVEGEEEDFFAQFEKVAKLMGQVCFAFSVMYCTFIHHKLLFNH